uniref:Solute carrier family 23 member 1 n=1 Tax=Plectus sambesii TaxID=2011161 RepID=A0A914XA74_9BILA
MVGGVGLSSVQFVNLNLSRNVAILGLAIMSGMAVPLYFEQYPLNTGMAELDQVLNILLTIRMFVGGFVGFLLDNTVPRASREQRGLQPHNTNEKSGFDDGADHECYSFPPLVNRILARIPLVRLLPFLPELKIKVAGTTGPHKLIIPIDTANLYLG